MKTGLVLEGGAKRGLFTAGVLDVLMENSVYFDGIIGVSAGATFGCNYKSNQPGRVLRYNSRYIKDPRFGSMVSLIKNGDLFIVQFCYHDLPEKYDVFDYETYRSSETDFYIVCTDIKTGKPLYRKCNSLDSDEMECMRASASLPLAANIVEVYGHKVLDGGLSDSIPLKYFQDIGYEKNVVILTRPRGYIKETSKSLPVVKWKMKKYHEFVKTFENRPHMYNAQTKYIFEQEKEGNTFVICPEEALTIKDFDRNIKNNEAVYYIGRNVAEKNIGKSKDFIQK